MTQLIHFLSQPRTAAAILDPLRIQLLANLGEPDSAAGLARRLNLPRQRLNYHLRELEKESLVELVAERKKGNCTERLLRATARAYLISPAALGELAADPAEMKDRFSSAYLAAATARALSEVGELRERADAEGKGLGTLTMESAIRFANATSRSAFAEELSQAVARLIAKYHDGECAGGRRFSLLIGAYPAVSQRESGEREQAVSSEP